MRTQPHTGKQLSYCKVLVNSDEHETPQDALAAWPKVYAGWGVWKATQRRWERYGLFLNLRGSLGRCGA